MKPTKGTIERRSLTSELRASKEKEFVLEGYAASFNTLSRDLGGFKERLAPGCFSRSLASGTDIKCLFNHDASMILGRSDNGTLECEEDERGLRFRCQLNRDSQAHRDLYASIKRGDISECSFAFTMDDEDWQEWDDVIENGQRFVRRTIKRANLLDVSAVTYPAYADNNATAVSARSADYGVIPDAEFVAQTRAKLAQMDADYTKMIDEHNLAYAARVGAQIIRERE